MLDNNKEELTKFVLDTISASEYGQFVNFLMDEVKNQTAEINNVKEHDMAENKVEEKVSEKPQEIKADASMVSDAERRHYSRLEAENASLKKELGEVKTAARKIQIESELKALEQENVQFDFKEEFERMSVMQNPILHANLMRKNYSRKVTNVNLEKTYQPKVPDFAVEAGDPFSVMDKFEYNTSGIVGMPTVQQLRAAGLKENK